MNETKKYLVITAIAQGKKTKKRACVELNLSERQINRLLLAYQPKGKEAFRHENRELEDFLFVSKIRSYVTFSALHISLLINKKPELKLCV